MVDGNSQLNSKFPVIMIIYALSFSLSLFCFVFVFFFPYWVGIDENARLILLFVWTVEAFSISMEFHFLLPAPFSSFLFYGERKNLLVLAC